MPGVVDGVRGQFVSAAETIVGIDRLDVQSEQFSLLAGDNEGYGSVGAEDVPEDVSEERK